MVLYYLLDALQLSIGYVTCLQAAYHCGTLHGWTDIVEYRVQATAVQVIPETLFSLPCDQYMWEIILQRYCTNILPSRGYIRKHIYSRLTLLQASCVEALSQLASCVAPSGGMDAMGHGIFFSRCCRWQCRASNETLQRNMLTALLHEWCETKLLRMPEHSPKMQSRMNCLFMLTMTSIWCEPEVITEKCNEMCVILKDVIAK